MLYIAKNGSFHLTFLFIFVKTGNYVHEMHVSVRQDINIVA